MKKIIWLFNLLAASLIFSGCSQTAGNTGTVYVVSTNDMHANVLNYDSGIDLALVSGLKQQYDALLFDAGDALQGAPLAILSDGDDVLSLMKTAGYDAMALGNHEFDYGQEKLLEHAANAGFLTLCSNVLKENEELLSSLSLSNKGCYAVFEKNGYKIGVFALTTRQTLQSTDNRLLLGIKFKDEIASAKEILDRLRPLNLDAVILLAHLGCDDAPCTSEELAQALTGKYQDELDLIIDGHSHQEYVKKVNGVTISQTGSRLNKVGLNTLNFNDQKSAPQVTAALLSYEDLIDMKIVPDGKTKDLEQQLQQKQSKFLQQEIASLPFTLYGGEQYGIDLSRVSETQAGDLAADAIMYALKSKLPADFLKYPAVAIQNGGNIRVNLGPGPITYANTLYLEPFLNTLMCKIVSPKILYEMFEHSYRYLNDLTAAGTLQNVKETGGFLQISGLKIILEPNGKQKVKAIFLDGEKTALSRNDTKRQIMLAGNDFILSGSDGYTMLKDIPTLTEFSDEQEALISYLKHLKKTDGFTRYQKTQQRITFTPLPKNVNAYVNIRNFKQLGNNLKLHCSIDGEKIFPCQADQAGLLKLTLTPGSHILKIINAADEIYLNTILGIGIKKNSDLSKIPVVDLIN
ncbi:bifunctional UDP-sugar hydrolase/5'-nucleotidase [Succinatimonas hippei]|uniref:bifunctional metallophosphatase/5'-nucleotidase n=1 Tax=Succinatimonas hippei TaxID=626938 RepID=UPI0025A366A3|nr:bifunctional UDP-sugar hydrolase/5'-nucleotidase [Succinatimonas hippei]MDM8121137.1 bifunctional UDP-sugar hydrolase/5'-nucleotidase [Succinatimonas hippei]